MTTHESYNPGYPTENTALNSRPAGEDPSVLGDLAWGATATWPVAAVGPGFRPRILSFSSYRGALFNRVSHSEGPSATLGRATARYD